MISLDELLKHAAALPPHSAIFWELMIVDAAGIVHEGSTALNRLHAVANAPIFSYDESFFGGDIVGGPLLLVSDTAQKTAAAAVRILSGTKPSDMNTAPVQFAKPMFDWREMQRWGINESRLPPGSEILFRDPSAWERYRLQILAICAIVLAQVALISWLIYEHRRRNRAEVLARNHRFHWRAGCLTVQIRQNSSEHSASLPLLLTAFVRQLLMLRLNW
jgi:hypothetical protein